MRYEDEEWEVGLLVEFECGEEGKAVAFCVGHIDGDKRHWHVLLQLEDGRLIASDRAFASEAQAYEAGVEWLRECGAELAQ